MRPEDRYKTMLNEFGERLSTAHQPGRRRLVLPSIAIAVAGCAAVVAVIVAVNFSSNSGLDAIARAEEALAPDGAIVHIRITQQLPYGRNGAGNVEAATSERWSAENPTRWRVVSEDGDPRTEYPPVQFGYSDGRASQYSPVRNELHITTGVPERLMSPGSPLTPDPSRDIRPALESGRLRDSGEATVDGRRVRRLEGTLPGNRFTKVVYFVDAGDFTPVGGELEFGRKGQRASAAMRVTFSVDVYERIPDDAEHAHLLSIEPPPGTKIRTDRYDPTPSTEKGRTVAASP